MKRSLCVTAGTCCILLGGARRAALADTELASLAQVQWGNDLFALDGTSVEGTDMASAADGYTDGAATFSGNAHATATFGSLGVFADASVTNGAYLVHHASGSAGFTDGITIVPDDPLLDGTEGTMDLTFDVTGTSTPTGDGQVSVDLFVIVGEPDLLELPDLTFEQGGFAYTTDPFTFTYGQPFDLTVTLGVDASFLALLDPVTGTATGDFSHTVQLTDVGLFDGAGAPDRVSSLVAASGTAYPVPEPASLAPLLAAVAAIHRPRRRPATP